MLFLINTWDVYWECTCVHGFTLKRMARWLLVHHDGALLKPEEHISIEAVIDDYIISSDSWDMLWVIEKSELPLHPLHFLFPETFPETQEAQFLVFTVSAWYPQFDHLPSKQMLRRKPQVACVNELALTLHLISGDQPEHFELFKHRIVNKIDGKWTYVVIQSH